MNRVILAAALSFLATTAYANDVAPASTPASGAQNIPMTYGEARSAFQALRALGGKQDRTVKDGGQEHVVSEPYKFGPGLTLWIAHDLNALKPAVEDSDAALSNIQSVAKLDPAKAQADATALLKKRVAEMMNLFRLPADQLQKDNPIPADTLADLGPLLDDGTAPSPTSK